MSLPVATRHSRLGLTHPRRKIVDPRVKARRDELGNAVSILQDTGHRERRFRLRASLGPAEASIRIAVCASYITTIRICQVKNANIKISHDRRISGFAGGAHAGGKGAD